MSGDIGVWLGALATVSIYSFLYKDNVVFQVGQGIFVGLAAAHALVLGYQNVVQSAWLPLAERGQYLALVPMVLGILLYTRFAPRYAWLSRIPMAFLVGTAAGVGISGALVADLQRQILSTMRMGWTSPNNVIFILCVFCTLTYFLFIERKTIGPLQTGIRTVGMYTMMVAFGGAMGFTVMARLSLLIGRFQYLFGNWILLIGK